ncbi:MAG: cytochrome C oxidase subunit IV family protein [Anaerolineae bacterium]
MNEKKSAALRQGLLVLIGLAVLTAVEFGISFLEFSTIALFIIALFKAGLILQYFMHVALLWSEEEHE